MKKLKIMLIVFLFVLSLFSTIASAKSASVMLREGLYAEEIEGDIDGAIEIYREVVQDSSASRNYIAQALYRQGICYLKKKDESAARAVLGKLIAEYSDQTEIVEWAKPLWDDLANHDPADLMPPDTLVYMELGSPGKQIETILNMLKGTPFENPLAAIPGSRGQVGPGGKSPGEVLAALLNPGMMAEFKKIRGMAVGITEIRENNPAGVTVLYPGKSDALRGIILMALGMAGQRTEPIEAMETLNIQDSAAVAYDDTVIIIAQPAERLEWCVRQYKGITSEPTLASSNKSFAKVDKKTRQDNALTVWVDVDNVYRDILKRFPEAQSSHEMLGVNALVDFNNIDDLVVSFSIEQDGLVNRADVSFKEGHHCLVYDMVRTPNLHKAAFEAVPSDAVALVSVALSEASEAQIETVSKKIRNVTGLDIGREIFANIEQLTLFAVPSDKVLMDDVPFLPNIGLAITSHNPQQTRQILATLFGTANLVTTGQQTSYVDTPSGKYQISINGDQKLYCYMGQLNNTTVLSLNKDITDASVAAIRTGKSICNQGPLKDSISELPTDTSKLALVNVGGVISMAAPLIVGDFEESNRQEVHQALKQLAQACRQTTVELRTEEQLNNFVAYSAITGLPPVNEIFGPVMQISTIVKKAESKVKVEKLRMAPPVIVAEATKAPVIDGIAEEIWSAAHRCDIENVIYSPPSSPSDLSASYKTMWDADNLYVLVDVTDDVLINDTSQSQTAKLVMGSNQTVKLAARSTVQDAWWFDDCIEVYIDADNSKSDKYDDDDAQYHFDWDRTNPTMGVRQQHGRMENVEFAIATTEKGYRAEIKFPWATLGRKPATGASIGFDVHVNDDDDGGERDSKITWRDKKDTAWEKPRAFGNATLAGLVGWWKLDETEGNTAKDSSGGNHDGTLNGDPKWTKGKIGGAIELDGNGDFIQIGDESAFDITGQVTIACWVNIYSVPHEWMAIVTKGDNSWRLSTMGNQRIFHTSVAGWQQLMVNGSTTVAPNQWNHVAAVYDGDVMRIYLNGRIDAMQPWKGGIGGNDFGVLIGENAQERNRYFNGLIDDVRIYNYALREADIIALYNEGVKD